MIVFRLEIFPGTTQVKRSFPLKVDGKVYTNSLIPQGFKEQEESYHG